MTHVPSLQGFRYSTQRYGLMTGLGDFGYRLLRKTTAFNLHHILALSCKQSVIRNHSGDDCRFLSVEELQQFTKYPVYDLDSSMHQRAFSGQDLCYALLLNGTPISYCWLALDSIEAKHSAGLGASFPANVAYLYKTYTLPEYRGKGLSKKVLLSVSEVLRQRNYEHLFGIIEEVNRPSKSCCTKIGFESIGVLLSMFKSQPLLLSGANRLKDMGIYTGKNANIKSRQDCKVGACP